MKKFKFTLQPLLDLTLSMQEQLQLQMKQNEDALSRLVGELDTLFSQRTSAKEAYLNQVQRGVQAEELKSHTAYIDEYSDLIVQQEDRIDNVQRERQKLILEKTSNYQNLKKLENLKEKQYAQYLAQVKSDEEKMIGDLISYRIAAN